VISPIVVVSSAHSPFDNRIVAKQIKSICKLDHRVAFVVPSKAPIVSDGYETINLPKRGGRFFRFFILPILILVAGTRLRPRVIHFHDPDILFLCPFFRLFTRAAIIYDIHEDYASAFRTREWIPKGLRQAVSSIYRYAERILLAFVDQVILAEESYLDLYRHRADARLVRNFALLPPIRHEHDAAQCTESDLIYIGSIRRERGAEDMLHIVDSLTNRLGRPTRLLLLGPIEENYKKRLLALVSDLGLSGFVSILPPVPLSQVWGFLDRTKIGLSLLHGSPNLVHSLPTKLLDYYAAGLPVVVSDFPLWRRMIESDKTGLLVNPHDHERCARLILDLLSSSDLRESYGEQGRRVVVEKYNWKTEEATLLDVYNRMLSIQFGEFD
jgi:glycosyltransferase involved in cell wall biosynthesis